MRETTRLISSDKVEGTAVRRSNGVMIDKLSGKAPSVPTMVRHLPPGSLALRA
jgi:hypothetical protein